LLTYFDFSRTHPTMLSRFFIARPLTSSSLMLARPAQFSAYARFSTATTVPVTEATAEQAQPTQTQQEGEAAKEETLTVPKNLVRYLIGLKGKNLKSLSDKSGGAKIVFTKEDNGQGEEIAKIIGDSNQLTQARQAIKDELEKIKAEMANSQTQRAEYMEEVIVDSQYVGVLIGKQGSVLKEMEVATGATIQFSNRDDSSQERTARIRGTHEQVQAAKKKISDRIYQVADEIRAGQRFDPRRKQAGPKSRQPAENAVKQVVEVPSECIGPIIGKGGKGLFRMQDDTGAKFEFAKQDHRDGAREVTIFGSEDQIRAACDLLQERVRQVIERNAAA